MTTKGSTVHTLPSCRRDIKNDIISLPRIWAQELAPMVNEDVSLVGGGDHNFQYPSLLETPWWIQWEAVSIIVIGRSLKNALPLTEYVARGHLQTFDLNPVSCLHFLYLWILIPIDRLDEVEQDCQNDILKTVHHIFIELFGADIWMIGDPLRLELEKQIVLSNRKHLNIFVLCLPVSPSLYPRHGSLGDHLCRGMWGRWSARERVLWRCPCSSHLFLFPSWGTFLLVSRPVLSIFWF